MVESARAIRQQAFKDSFDTAMKRAGKTMADIVERFKAKSPDPVASVQAIYKWPKTGRVAEANLRELTDFLDCDYQTARMTGRLVPRIVAPPKSPEEKSDLPTLIYSKVRKLDQSAQLSVLNLIETIINVADPRYWEYVSNTRDLEAEDPLP
jgi:hypothetical protein